jgi:hypothetical protein
VEEEETHGSCGCVDVDMRFFDEHYCGSRSLVRPDFEGSYFKYLFATIDEVHSTRLPHFLNNDS